MATASIEELFRRTLMGDYEDEAPLDAVATLRRLGTREVFDFARSWCESDDPLKRARGLDVLAQLGKTVEHPSNSFPEEAYAVVAESARHEKDVRPLSSAIFALGHIENPAAVPLIASFRGHESAEIRFAVACALGCYPNDDLSIRDLLPLADDVDDDVRNWATFGIALGDRDSVAIRDVLYHRLSDENEEVREEAMIGLAKRKDARVLPALMAAVKGDQIKVRVAEAASLLLGMPSDPPDWGAKEYRVALEQRFCQCE